MYRHRILYRKVFDKVQLVKETGNVTRVSLLQQRICFARQSLNFCPPLFHVGLYAQDANEFQIFEHGPVQYDHLRDFDDDNTTIIQLPAIDKSVWQLQMHAKTLDERYFIGLRDCRHYVEDMLDYMYDL
jgi:hypothetical protein